MRSSPTKTTGRVLWRKLVLVVVIAAMAISGLAVTADADTRRDDLQHIHWSLNPAASVGAGNYGTSLRQHAYVACIPSCSN